MSTRTLLAAFLTAAVLVTTAVTASRLLPDSDGSGPAPPPPDQASAPVPAQGSPAPPLDPASEVAISHDGFLAWAVRDQRTGQLAHSGNAEETSSTESMVKVWIVGDHLRRLAESGRQPTAQDLEDSRLAIRDSHNGAAQRLYEAGGSDQVVVRMIDVCELEDTYIPPGAEGWWSRTEMSAVDAVRLGECVVDGRAAGPEWTAWLLNEMRNVRGTTAPEDQRGEEGFEGGRWGIIDALPAEAAEEVAIKNGWTRIGRTESWHLNCLAVTEDWVMAVMMRYPAERSLDYGAQQCADVARQLLDGRFVPNGRMDVN